jgi:hypothetical protein
MNRTLTRRSCVVWWLAHAVLCLGVVSPAISQQGKGDVVYVPTPQAVVESMLSMAKLGPRDYLIDLGSGDGRMVVTAARQFGARALGVDLDQQLLQLARENARLSGVAERAQFVEQNLFETDLSGATVITSYLLPSMNLKLRPKLLALPAGTRIVTHDYHFGDWIPDERKTLDVPEKKVGDPGKSYVYLWVVPEQIDGNWQLDLTQLQMDLPGFPAKSAVQFSQRFQMIEGQWLAGSVRMALQRASISGKQIVFQLPLRDVLRMLSGTTQTRPAVSAAARPVFGPEAVLEFDGRRDGNVLRGEVRIRRQDGGAVVSAARAWSASMTDMRLAPVRTP